jgi:hypothetical protein
VQSLRVLQRFVRFLAASLFLGAALGACDGETVVIIEVSSSDLRAPEDVDQLRFEVTSTGGPMGGGTYPVAGPWPHTLAVRPAPGHEADIVSVVVLGLKEGVAVARGTNTAPFVRGETVIVEVRLSRCAPGACPPPPGDGGVDMGVDLGTDMGEAPDGGLDSGEPSDGGMDLGDLDAGTDMGVDLGGDLGTDFGVDAGMDAGVDSGRDLGTDFGTDAGVDSGRDLGTDFGTDAGVDSGTDLGMDAGMDAGLDSGMDLGVDSGPPDLGVDMGTPRVVLSEVTTGPGLDEFVELYNAGDAPAPVGGFRIQYRSQNGSSWETRATIPVGVVIPPGGYYLLAGSRYTGTVAPDVPSAWTSGFSDTAGHVRLMMGDVELDRVGWGSPADMPMMPEGMFAPAPGAARSLERKAVETSTAESMSAGGADERRGNGFDSNDNARDFVVRDVKDPQNSTSPPEFP